MELTVQSETRRLEQARAQAITQLCELARRSMVELGPKQAQVLEIHRLMLEDADFADTARDFIAADGASATRAVELTARRLAGLLESSGSEHIRQRADDVWDAARRVIDILDGTADSPKLPEYPFILAAEQLLPSHLAALDKTKLLAIVLAEGAEHSHTAVLARAIGVPAVFGVGSGLTRELDGVPAIVDGNAGKVYIRPDKSITAIFARLNSASGRPVLKAATSCVTLDGVSVAVTASIGGVEEAAHALRQGADGVGLLRSELLFFGATIYPSEDEQLDAYRQIVENMSGKRVCVRTLDLGGDKPAAYLPLPWEENPALGLRGGRISLEHPELLRTQLRALYRASAFGNVAILFPMVSALWEARELLSHAARARQELWERGLPFNEGVQLGIMIETPAAALISGELAAIADFFSIGSNDLTQYALAADRQSGRVVRYYDQTHPAVLRLIELACQSAVAAGIPISLCGELAGNIDFTRQLLRMGVRELSVAPHRVSALCKKIRGIFIND